MPAIGITGGVATGKSTFCNYLRELLPAAKFFDADEAAHRLVDLAEVGKAIREEFGAGVFSDAGELNRAALRAIVFRDAAKRRALEQILHPRIRRQWSALAETHRNSSEFFFADIPLLYETGGETLCDRVVVVACSREVQVARLLARDATGHRPVATEKEPVATSLCDVHQIEKMINSQMPLEEKISLADHVVWNNDGTGVLREQAKLLVALWQSLPQSSTSQQ
jgi:dephospho-CoA kinase